MERAAAEHDCVTHDGSANAGGCQDELRARALGVVVAEAICIMGDSLHNN